MKKILIIDDAEHMVLVLANELQRSGFQTVVASDGAIGIELATQQNTDLILCDVNMPFVDGFETFKAIRGNEGTANIPFVFISGFSCPSDQAKNISPSHFLEKPFSSAQLLETVKAALDLKEANRC